MMNIKEEMEFGEEEMETEEQSSIRIVLDYENSHLYANLQAENIKSEETNDDNISESEITFMGSTDVLEQRSHELIDFSHTDLRVNTSNQTDFTSAVAVDSCAEGIRTKGIAEELERNDPSNEENAMGSNPSLSLNSGEEEIDSPSKYRKRLRQKKEFCCTKCKFKTLWKHELDSHVANHSDNSIRCFACKYETNLKGKLQNHVLKHFRRLIKCHGWNCGFETNKRRILALHLKNKCKNQIFECAFCSYETMFKFKLRTHNCEERKICRRNFRCYICKCLMLSRDNFRRHLLQHFNQQEFKFFICRIKKKRIKKIETSLQVRRSRYILFKCLKCGFKTIYKSSLKSHILNHYKLKTFLCQKCPFVARRKSKLQEHMLTSCRGTTLTLAKELFKCPKCNFNASEKTIVDNHMATTHKDDACSLSKNPNIDIEKQISSRSSVVSAHSICNSHSTAKESDHGFVLFMCSVCSYSSIVKANVDDLLTQGFFVVLPPDNSCAGCGAKNSFKIQLLRPSPSFACSKCSYKSTDKQEFDRHVLEHEVNILKFSKCKFKTADEKDLKEHSSRCQGKVFECPECSFVTDGESHLDDHMKSHLYECDKFVFKSVTSEGKKVDHACPANSPCEYQRSNMETYGYIKENNTELFKYECSLCKYKTNDNVILEAHALIHSEEYLPQQQESNVFKCSKCKFEGATEEDLEEHLLSHYQGNVFECSECSFVTSVESQLKDHIKIHLYECNKCDFKSMTSQSKKVEHACLAKDPTCEDNMSNREARIQNESFKYKCFHCEYKTYDNVILEAHALIHSEERLPLQHESNVLKCSKCKFKGVTEKDLEEHLLSHYQGNVFECSECPFVTSVESQLKDHIKIHLYECDKCDFKSSTIKGQTVKHICLRKCRYCDYRTDLKCMSRHKKKKHPELVKHKCSLCTYKTDSDLYYGKHLAEHSRGYKCPHCNYETKSKSGLMCHLLRHNPKEIFKCDRCDYETVYKDSFQKHMETHLMTKKKLKCAECDYSCLCKSSLKNHMAKHTGDYSFECTHCEYKTMNVRYYQKHILIHSTKEVKCPQCNYAGRSEANIRCHMKVHSDRKLFKCDTCNYETNYRHNLKTHVLKHTRERLFKCDQCDFTSNYKFCVDRHVQVTHDKEAGGDETIQELNESENTELQQKLPPNSTPKGHKCPLCDYTTAYIGNLRVHKQTTHSESEKYFCPQCKFSTKHKRNLDLHTIGHLEGTPLKCFYCEFAADSKKDLRTHILEHERDKEEREGANSSPPKRFICEDCDFASTSRVGYNQHRKTHMTEQQFKCPECQYATNFKGNLTKHAKLKHSGKGTKGH